MNNHEFSNEHESIDAKLASAAQCAMRDVVRALPEDAPSMAWRSGLNERLLVDAARRRRRARFFWALRPAAGLAFAGALTAVFVFRTSPMNPAPTSHSVASSSSSLEAGLLSTHSQVAAFADVAGTGVRPIETTYVSKNDEDDDLDWSEVDIESL